MISIGFTLSEANPDHFSSTYSFDEIRNRPIHGSHVDDAKKSTIDTCAT